MKKNMPGLKDILEAKNCLAPILKPTNLIFSDYFSELLAQKIYFKPENLQITGAFKIRGAYYKLFELSQKSQKRQVICASAGNHAQGLALAGKKLGFQVQVVMPEETPIIKVEAVKKLNAEVILFGKNFEEANLEAEEISRRENIDFIHPYNDKLVIAGQGTIGLEIIEELPEVGTILVPVGGGGLIAGVSLAAKETIRKPKIHLPKIIGVRSQTKIADGILVKRIGSLPKSIINQYVDEMVKVDEDEIALAIQMLLEKSKLVVEGAGAVGLAVLLSGKIQNLIEPMVIVLSGGNIDINLVGKIIRRGLHNLNRMVSIIVEVDDRPGVLAELSSLIAKERANIYQIDHERFLPNLSLTKSRVKIVLEIWSKEHIFKITEKLKQAGYQVKIL